jgi:hypothetical protein
MLDYYDTLYARQNAHNARQVLFRSWRGAIRRFSTACRAAVLVKDDLNVSVDTVTVK